MASMAPSAAEHAASMSNYFESGVARGQSYSRNRGPFRRGEDGRLHPEILAAFEEHGFFVFEGVVAEAEIAELREEIQYLLDHAPTGKDSDVDAQGRPAYGGQFARSPYSFIKPLSDPWGGTELLNGRHPHQMVQPKPKADAPKETPYILSGMCQTMPSGLRLYGHPSLLTIAAGINGDDFVPFNDAIFVKQPGLGGSVAWHQDGVTHWKNPDWDPGIHGFNFQVQLYPTTPANCLWIIPGTHKEGRADIRKRIKENNGSELLPGAIPLTCGPGDVTIVNRQVLHCSFANTSDDLRISMTFGFHRYKSVLGQKGALSQSKEATIYDEQRIDERASVIQVAIDARAQYYCDEAPFDYVPFAGRQDDFRWDDATYERVIKDYNLKDLAI